MRYRNILLIGLAALVLMAFFVVFHGYKPAQVTHELSSEVLSQPMRFKAGEYLIRVKDERTDELAQILKDHGLVLKMPLLFGWALVGSDGNDAALVSAHHPRGASTLDVLADLYSDSRLSVVSLNHEVESAGDEDWIDAADTLNDEPSLSASPSAPGFAINDPYFAQQWNLQASSPTQRGAMDVEAAWRITRGSPKVTLAVIEEGFALSHPDLRGASYCNNRFLPSLDGSKNANLKPASPHGTYVLGILAACSDNHLGISGVDWYARVLPVRRGQTTGDILMAILWSMGFDPCQEGSWKCPTGGSIVRNPNPADVINMSFVVASKKLEQRFHKFLVRDFWQEAMSAASRKNTIMVAAAGNESVLLSPLLHAPAGSEGVIAVGSVDKNGISPHNSRFGPDVDILAPGVQIWTTQGLPGTYALERGTSFAAPEVSGVVSLMKSVYPALTWKSARYFMQASATPLKCEQYCGMKSNGDVCIAQCCDAFGQSICPGLVNAGRAVQMAKDCQDMTVPGPCTKVGTQVLPNVPLVDVDKYVVFAELGVKPQSLVLSNRGAQDAWIRVKASDADLLVGPVAKKPVEKFLLRGGSSMRLVISRKVSKTAPVDGTLTFEARLKDTPFDVKKPPIDRITTTIRYKSL
jgi:subtilisin family serine protease